MRIFKYVMACAAVLVTLQTAQLWADDDNGTVIKNHGQSNSFGQCIGGCGGRSWLQLRLIAFISFAQASGAGKPY